MAIQLRLPAAVRFSQEDLGVSRAADFMADTSDEVPKKTSRA